MPAMLFQASIFRTFQRIFKERHRPQHKVCLFTISLVYDFVYLFLLRLCLHRDLLCFYYLLKLVSFKI